MFRKRNSLRKKYPQPQLLLNDDLSKTKISQRQETFQLIHNHSLITYLQHKLNYKHFFSLWMLMKASAYPSRRHHSKLARMLKTFHSHTKHQLKSNLRFVHLYLSHIIDVQILIIGVILIIIINAIQEDQAEAKLSVKKPEIVEEKTLKRPSAKKDKDDKVKLKK